MYVNAVKSVAYTYMCIVRIFLKSFYRRPICLHSAPSYIYTQGVPPGSGSHSGYIFAQCVWYSPFGAAGNSRHARVALCNFTDARGAIPRGIKIKPVLREYQRARPF